MYVYCYLKWPLDFFLPLLLKVTGHIEKEIFACRKDPNAVLKALQSTVGPVSINTMLRCRHIAAVHVH